MLRLIGAVLLVLGLAVLVRDWLAAEGGFRLTALGEWWFWAHPQSIQIAQPAVERHVHPSLWSHGLQPILEWPLAVELLVLGALLLAAGILRHRRRRRVSRSA